MAIQDLEATKETFVPATGWRILLPWYDFLVRIFTRERYTKQHVLEACDIQESEQLLDVGCGSGTFLKLVHEHCDKKQINDVRLIGVDADEAMVRWSRKKVAKVDGIASSANATTEVHRANSTSLPFESESFTLVTCSLVLHHLTTNEKRQALCEMRRVLSSSGHVLIADFGLPANRLARIQFWIARVFDGLEQTQANVNGEIPELIRQSGFKDLQETLTLPTPLGTLRCYRAKVAVPSK